MNLSLVDPFVLAQDCPEVITGRLSASYASPTARLHPRADVAQAAATARRSASATAATSSPPDGYAMRPPIPVSRPLITAPLA